MSLDIAALELVSAERRKQILRGYTTANDSAYVKGELVEAAHAYMALVGHRPNVEVAEGIWPWSVETFKPGGTELRHLVKASALLLAEIERRLALGQQQ